MVLDTKYSDLALLQSTVSTARQLAHGLLVRVEALRAAGFFDSIQFLILDCYAMNGMMHSRMAMPCVAREYLSRHWLYSTLS